jgi:CheY-like chemotaxis protein/AraC-like DNA-binding protein
LGKLGGSPISQFLISNFSSIRRNGQQLLNLVNQMLDLSKVESGAMKLNMVQGDVVNYLRYLAESFNSLAKSKEVRLHFQTELPELVMDYEPQRLQQVVSNLLSNAFKFTPAGGEVKLEIGKLASHPISQFPISPISRFLISISDTGIGIPEDKLPFVFDRFFQVESAVSSSRANNTGGTGIGLALAKELVKLMKGDISVSSKLGEGTTFTVALPISRQASPPAPLEEETHLPLAVEILEKTVSESSHFDSPFRGSGGEGAPLLLLIEDNPDVVKYLFTCLPGYRIEVAQDGEIGIEKAFDLIPDLILSDVMMPKKDGFEVCQILKNDERTSHVPIILLTAKADVESKLAGLERGADAYLPKPFHKEELLVRIRKLLELRQKLQAHYFALATGSAGAASTSADLAESFAAVEDAFVLKLRGIIESHLDDAGFSVEQLCREAAMSRAQLFRKLRALTGQSAGGLIRSIRIAKAKQLLREDPSLTIAAVAYDTGFSDPDYFAKVFKEEVGVPPSEWRKA